MSARAFVGLAGALDPALAERALSSVTMGEGWPAASALHDARAGVRARVWAGDGAAVPGSTLTLGASTWPVRVTWTDEGCVSLFADAFGRRSLFVSAWSGALAFGTSLRAVRDLRRALGAPPTLDPRAFRRFYALSCVPPPRTAWREIAAVPPAHVAHWARATPSSFPSTAFERARELTVGTGDDAPGDEEAVARVLDAIDASTARAFSPSSAPALLLSGGLDSALVATGLSRAGIHAPALTIDLDEGSEVEDARAIAAALRLSHHAVRVDGAVAMALLDEAVRALDVPIGDPVVVPFLVAARAARSLGAGALWNGEGGDQLFAGWQTKPMLAWARYAAADEDPASAYLATFHKLAEVEQEALGEALLDEEGAPLLDELAPLFAPARRARHASFLHLLCEANLFSKGAWNVSPRLAGIALHEGLTPVSPLLDEGFVDMSFALRPTQKQRGLTEKWVLREALAGVLPEAIARSPKRGMRVPLTAWLAGPLRECAGDVLGSRAFRERGHVRPHFAEALLAGDVHAPDLRRRRRDEWLWLVLAGELWARAQEAP